MKKDFSRKGAKAQRKTSGTEGLNFAPLRLCARNLLLILVCISPAFSQTKPTHAHASMSPEAKALLEEAIGVVCTQAKLDPKSSVAIDEMQARPSLPLQSPEARAGAERAQRLLPLTKNLTIAALEQLANEYGFEKSPAFRQRIKQAIARVNSVKRVRPDMDSRDK